MNDVQTVLKGEVASCSRLGSNWQHACQPCVTFHHHAILGLVFVYE